MSKLTQPIKVHGGKHYLADRIIGLMPPRAKNPNNPADDDPGWLHYVEPYAGGLAVLLAMDPEGISEVANDTHQALVNFWTVLASDEMFETFCRKAQATPFDEGAYNASMIALQRRHEDDLFGRVDWAVGFFVACRQSLAGRMQGFASVTRNRTRKGMNEQVSAWLNAVEGLPMVHSRLKRVLILDQPAIQVIAKQDGPRTLFYLDPPYLHSTRATTKEYGDNEMTDEDHAALLGMLSTIKGRFLLSGYQSEMYDKAAKEFGWKVHVFEVDNKASGGKEKRRMFEHVWCNF